MSRSLRRKDGLIRTSWATTSLATTAFWTFGAKTTCTKRSSPPGAVDHTDSSFTADRRLPIIATKQGCEREALRMRGSSHSLTNFWR